VFGFPGFEPGVQMLDVSEFLCRHPPANAACRIVRPDAGEQRLVLAGGLLHRRPAGDQFQEQPVHPVQRRRAGPGELITAVAQQPQDRQFRVTADLP